MYQIRYASVADAEILGMVHARSWQAAYAGIVPNEFLAGMNPLARQEHFAQALSEGREHDAIIFADDKPVGLTTIGKCRDQDKDDTFGEIWGIYLLPEFWNQGIGTVLLRWGLHELYLQGYRQASLWVLKDNIRARKFYEKNGFAWDGSEKEIFLGKLLIECRYVNNSAFQQ
jgi:ribosomal protein S18 acetylase RimI-like enzyme